MIAYLASVKYSKVGEDGKMKNVSEKYLVDAMTYTEAETRLTEELSVIAPDGFSMPTITQPKLAEIFVANNPDANRWYKVGINYITLDETGYREKKTPSTMFVQATDFNDALERFENGMKGTFTDYEIASVSETNIVDYLKHEGK